MHGSYTPTPSITYSAWPPSPWTPASRYRPQSTTHTSTWWFRFRYVYSEPTCTSYSRLSRTRGSSTQQRCPPTRVASPWRDRLGVVVTSSLPMPHSIVPTLLEGLICGINCNKRNELLHHLRTSTDEPHTTCRYSASEPPNAPLLLELGVLRRPLA
jgi:hypothetical protein